MILFSLLETSRGGSIRQYAYAYLIATLSSPYPALTCLAPTPRGWGMSVRTGPGTSRSFRPREKITKVVPI